MLPLLTPALEAFIKLAEKIGSLEKTKLQDRRDMFNEIVKPLFEELEPVASNYMEFFRKAQRIIFNSQRNDYETVVLQLHDDRNAMIMARIKVREMANQIGEHINDEEINKFTTLINNYFYAASSSGALLSFTSYAENVLVAVESIPNYDINEMVKTELTNLIDEILSNLEQSWASIVQSYGKLKIYSVSSPKFIRKN